MSAVPAHLQLNDCLNFHKDNIPKVVNTVEHILDLASSGLVEEVEGFVITLNIDVDDEGVKTDVWSRSWC